MVVEVFEPPREMQFWCRALRFHRIDTGSAEGVLELLTIRFDETDTPGGTVELAFAGGGTVRLAVECLEARMQDLGAAWAAKATPGHAL